MAFGHCGGDHTSGIMETSLGAAEAKQEKRVRAGTREKGAEVVGLKPG